HAQGINPEEHRRGLSENLELKKQEEDEAALISQPVYLKTDTESNWQGWQYDGKNEDDTITISRRVPSDPTRIQTIEVTRAQNLDPGESSEADKKPEIDLNIEMPELNLTAAEITSGPELITKLREARAAKEIGGQHFAHSMSSLFEQLQKIA